MTKALNETFIDGVNKSVILLGCYLNDQVKKSATLVQQPWVSHLNRLYARVVSEEVLKSYLCNMRRASLGIGMFTFSLMGS